MKTLRELIVDLTSRRIRCEELIADALDKAHACDGVFTKINDGVLAQARDVDRARAGGVAVPGLAGVPVVVKDLFDVQGQRTLAGAFVLRDEATAATRDAVVVGNLRDAGVLLLARANMTEFAFSGMGLNPHYGNAKCIWDRRAGRLPGGSSSGNAVCIAEGVVAAGVGSDTAGSCRVPAAFNGVVGVKPTFGRLSLRGVYPLSPTSDAPGPLANDVDGCFLLDHVMAGRLQHGAPLPNIAPRAPQTLTVCIPEAVVMESLEMEVADAFARAVQWLTDAGVAVVHRPLPVLDACVEMFSSRAVAVFESWLAHAERLQQRGDEYDPFVRRRMSAGDGVDEQMRAARYREKAGLIADFQKQSTGADVLMYPTVQCIPPLMSETENVDAMSAINFKCLRNASTANYVDGCAVSLPCHSAGDAPVGVMLVAAGGDDGALYEVAAAVEDVFNRRR